MKRTSEAPGHQVAIDARQHGQQRGTHNPHQLDTGTTGTTGTTGDPGPALPPPTAPPPTGSAPGFLPSPPAGPAADAPGATLLQPQLPTPGSSQAGPPPGGSRLPTPGSAEPTRGNGPSGAVAALPHNLTDSPLGALPLSITALLAMSVAALVLAAGRRARQ